MAKDKYWQASQRAMRGIDAAIGQAQGELNSAVACGDKDSAASSVQELASLARQKQDLELLRQQYAASRTPQQPIQKTGEQWQSAPIEQMDARDAERLWQTSRYGKDLTWGDPHVRQGWAEAMRRRQRGE